MPKRKRVAPKAEVTSAAEVAPAPAPAPATPERPLLSAGDKYKRNALTLFEKRRAEKRARVTEDPSENNILNLANEL